MGMKSVIVFIILIAIVSRWILNIRDFLSLPPDFEINDKTCQLAGMGVGMIGSEDTGLGKHSVVFISSGDLDTVFKEGANAANPGGIWAMDMRLGAPIEPVKLKIISFPLNRRFQPHGLHISNVTDRIHVVSHNEDHSSVDIFKIEYNVKCLKKLPWNNCKNPVLLTFLTSVKSELFPNVGLNDVVEGNKNEFYVSQFRRFSKFQR